MKTLIVYYSLEGNTEYVVEKIIGLSPEFDIPEKIFQDPLPTELTDENDEYNEWIGA